MEKTVAKKNETKISVLEFAYLKPEELAEKQHEELKKHCISVLQNVISIIQKEKYKEILGSSGDTDVTNLVCYSPAGDDMGSDNHYINFGGGMDIVEISTRLNQLKQIKDLWKKKEDTDGEN